RPKQPPLGILNQKGENKICPTELERDNFVENYSKGALYAQPCNDKRCNCEWKEKEPDVVFEIFVLQAKLVYNKARWHDPVGRFYVLKEQVEEYTGCRVTIKNREELVKEYIDGIENGYIDVEPLVIRANKGDCIEVRLTNFLPETLPATEFQLKTLTDNVSFHVHLVKFDVITSDGGANGYNNIASVFYGETLVERYYANEELNACFFHDHLNPNSHQQHGLFGGLIIEPKGSTYHDPRTGKRIKYGTKAVIKTPSGRAFREFGLFVHDFALLFDRHKKALNPPPFAGSHDDPGVMGINYKCEPLRERLNDKYDDPADVFNSNVHGDPVTPILETYPGEEIVIRLLDGAQEEQHIFNIHGMKWRKEITDRKSPLVQSQTLGISEAFNIRITDDYKAGDYIYYFGGQDDLWLGLWGIIRVYKNKNNKLIPIDSCKKCSFDKVKSYKDEIKDCMIKSKYCPYKKVREFHIAAIQKDLIYNKYKDHDPYGLLFVPYEIKDDVISGKIEPKPLILRANKGEYIKITLTNCFNEQIPFLEYPGVPVDKEITPSMRVGISTQFLRFDPVKDSGVNIGYNGEEQTVAPGESKTYLWYADEEYGTCLLSSFTDIRNHRYHGLFGAIIIEPEGAKISSSYDNGYKADYQEQVLVSTGKNDKFREFVLFMQNGIRLVDEKGNLIKTTVEEEEPIEHGESEISTENTLKDELAIEPVDFEDRGEKGFNYKSERFFNRLQHNPDISKVFSSKEHEDPSTPVLEAYPGEKVIIRLLMPADKPRNTSFIVHGHEWMAQPDDIFTRIISTQGAISVGNVFNIELLNGASMVPGDYLYRSSIIKWDIESGMWGILRIKDDDNKAIAEKLELDEKNVEKLREEASNK
ncbi:MAG: hypothetical protein ACI3VO_10220, partial [Intestinibacter sp.]